MSKAKAFDDRQKERTAVPLGRARRTDGAARLGRPIRQHRCPKTAAPDVCHHLHPGSRTCHGADSGL